jgi:hypothetical protein
MAIFHMEVKVVGRGKGRSAVEAAAYRSGEKLFDERYGLKRCLGDPGRVVFTKIHHPNLTALGKRPREALWNSVEAHERRKDAQLAREIEIALPVELTLIQQVRLLDGWCRRELLTHRIAIDYCIHDKKQPDKPANPHCHILCTLRQWEDGGWGPKQRELNSRSRIARLRKSWADHVNRALVEAGIEASIDHRSHEERGLTTKPMQKEGAGARGRVQRGLKSERVEENERIREHNASLKPQMDCQILPKPVPTVERSVNVEASEGLTVDVLNALRTRGQSR